MRSEFDIRQDVMPGVRGPNVFSTNSQGFRGDEMPPESFEHIVVIGGSGAECLFLDDQETWPYLVQKILCDKGYPVWVGNVGKSGEVLRGHIRKLKYLIAKHPEIDTILLLAGGNDFLDSLWWGDSKRRVPCKAPFDFDKEIRVWLLWKQFAFRIFDPTVRYYSRFPRGVIGDNYVRLRRRRQKAALTRKGLPPHFGQRLEAYVRG
ncbi:MAG: hypothetical protein NC930_04230, partial [Candidatus Omnitrophica bacterium]|nr:hypothetical protein [Candidatus Omnitrophota bacterium]